MNFKQENILNHQRLNYLPLLECVPATLCAIHRFRYNVFTQVLETISKTYLHTNSNCVDYLKILIIFNENLSAFKVPTSSRRSAN